MKKNVGRFALTGAIILMVITSATSQTPIPEILYKGSIPDQYLYLENRTTIYENYRAVREDMFQLVRKNTLDSMSVAKNRITGLTNSNKNLDVTIDSLISTLNDTRDQLREMTSTKNAITLLGISINKNVYNSIMWIIIAALAFLLGIGYLAFKKSFSVTRNTMTELKDLKKEFEDYRTKTRLEREKMSMDHFKEVQKLKGKS